MASISKIVNSTLIGLNPRQREVLKARFGLERATGDGETLAAIGDRLKVTRERVRQIEGAGTRLARANLTKSPEAGAIVEKIKKFIVGRGGVAKRNDVLEYAASFTKDIRANQVDFLAEVSGAFKLYREDDDFFPFYYDSEKSLRGTKAFVENWINHLRGRKEKVFAGSYRAEFANFMKMKAVPTATAENILGISRQIHVSPYGDIGLREWPEIRPVTVRDKIYLVLKKKEEPLHFEDIAKHINLAKFDAQEALAPTVHNELIKDGRFVLVGRGMYGLRENGYEPGTAREVIARVLKNEGPLTPTDVLTKVNRQRFFKSNTVLINLQNRSFFERLPDGRYRVREA